MIIYMSMIKKKIFINKASIKIAFQKCNVFMAAIQFILIPSTYRRTCLNGGTATSERLWRTLPQTVAKRMHGKPNKMFENTAENREQYASSARCTAHIIP